MLRFEEPIFFWLALVVPPLIVLSWRALWAMDRLRRSVVILLRAIVLLAIVLMLAQPRTVREHDHLTVVGLLDVSGSVRQFAQMPQPQQGINTASNIAYLRDWFRVATSTRADDDRFGLIVFDGEAMALSPPTRAGHIDDNLDAPMVDGTNIAEALQLGAAMLPADTAGRLVLVTDGNETAGDLLRAVEELAGQAPRDHAPYGVPIDVLPLAYSVAGDVQIVRAEAPPSARPEQVVTVRILLDSAVATSGRLSLRREGLPVDLNGAAAGDARTIDLPAGRSVQLAEVKLGATPINRFEAVFEPDDPLLDAVVENNRAEAFVATPSKGSVLVVDRRATLQRQVIASMLHDADVPVQLLPPEGLPNTLLGLQSFDLVVLNDIAASEISPMQQALLRTYVHDMGGGLMMVGGEDSFGAGGWNGTPVEDVLPLELDPPLELRAASAALVLVLDRSGSMNQGVAGARASQQAVANEAAALAIESLRSDSMVGVVTFNMGARVHVPLQRNDDPGRIAERVRAIRADGGTNLRPALQLAYDMLRDVEAEKKRIVCLSDGHSVTTEMDDLIHRMRDDEIALTTIAVGDDADHELLAHLADLGEGEFYPVRNPRTLPRVLVDSVQVLNKPLIKEGAFAPLVLPTGSSLTIGMDRAPELGGLVITAPRDQPTVTVEMTHPEGEPLLAHWQAGLGRVAAFTSDAGGPWSASWIDWPAAATFWTQLCRMIARPPINTDAELLTDLRDDALHITYQTAPSDDPSRRFLQVDGKLYTPDLRSTNLHLSQTAPGRYEATVPALQAGNYIVALTPRQGPNRLPPMIGGVSKSTSPEFRRFRSNLALLERVVQMTGGRRLDLADPQALDIFDRTGMPRSTSALPAWKHVLWFVLAMLLLDIVARRIAWSSDAVRARLGQMMRRVAPARIKGEEASATLASLRGDSVREESPGVRAAASESSEAMPPGRDELATPPPLVAAGYEPAKQEEGPAIESPHRDAPTKEEVNAAIDALLGRPAKKPVSDQTPDESPPDDEDARSAARSSLLEAKRRAQRQLRDEHDA